MLCEDYTYDIPVIRSERIAKGGNMKIFTRQFPGDTIWLSSTFPVATWFVYLDNYKLENRYLFSDSSRLGITIPEIASVITYGRLRVWATDGDSLTEMRQFPLAHGKLVQDLNDWDSLAREVVDWNRKLEQYDIAADSTFNNLAKLLITGEQKIGSRMKDRLSDGESQKLSILRNNMAVLFGEIIPLRIEKFCYAYLRSYFGQEVVVVVNKKNELSTLKLDLPKKYRKKEFKALLGNRFSYDNYHLLVDVPAYSVEVIYN